MRLFYAALADYDLECAELTVIFRFKDLVLLEDQKIPSGHLYVIC